MRDLELRMYGLVPFNISPIQQAIQYGHAVVEYGQMVKRLGEDKQVSIQYDNWADNWKTFIILNGGTSNHSKNRYSDSEVLGTMETNLKILEDNDIKISTFYEPDLNDMLSAIVFIVDERVFNRKEYPDFIDWLSIKDPDTYSSYNINIMSNSEKESDVKIYNDWVELMGGEKNIFLRDFLKNFRLA